MNGGYEYIYGRIKYSKIDKRNDFIMITPMQSSTFRIRLELAKESL